MFGASLRVSSRFCALAAVLLAAGSAGAVTQDSFKLRTGVDIVELCSVGVDDPLFVAAIHMCHGFGVSSYQTLVAINAHEKIGGFFCPPSEVPLTRNQAVADFLDWARQPQNSSHLNDSPAALIGRFLLTKYPCPKPGVAGGGL
jgi:hypothetical protein